MCHRALVIGAMLIAWQFGLAVPGSQSSTLSNAADVRLALPPVIYGTPGIEANIYFENVCLILNAANYAFDVTCDKGLQLQDRWVFTPRKEEAGEFPFHLAIRNSSNEIVAQASSLIRVIPRSSAPEREVSLLLVGASLTQYSIYPQHLLNLAADDPGMNLRLVGSRGVNNKPAEGPLRHEGYSGWTAEAFATLHGPMSRSGVLVRPDPGSPFMYETDSGDRVLDFQRYCDEFNQGQAPDLITIQLGTNDIFRETDATIEQRVERTLEYFDQLIEMIRKVSSGTKIGLVLVAPASRSQDGFRNYAGSRKQTAWQYRRYHHRLIERMIEHYSDRTDEKIYLVPVNVNLDVDGHYPTRNEPRNARSSERVVRVSNGTHPSDEGYRQIGDTIYAWIVAATQPLDASHQHKP
jgi:lysophospholipase L1-like esterase